MVFASGCATQQQTGQAMKVGGTAAVVAGAAVAEYARCSGSPDAHYAGLAAAQGGCRAKGSSQTLGAVIAAAGIGTALLGEAVERDANRREAYNRGSAPSIPPSPSAQGGVRSTALLALPEPPFSPKKPARSNDPVGSHEEGASDANGTPEAAPAPPGQTEPAPVE
jgi:hypothetical protein